MDNPEQKFQICKKRRAILRCQGHALILGGPGSGKTTIALLKARRFVLERLNDEQSVLFLSFSNAAIRRILESAANILSDDVGSRIEIKTYHSFAWEILRSHGYLISTKRQLSIISSQDAAVRKAGLSQDAWKAEQNRLFCEEGLTTYDQFAPRAADALNRSTIVRECFNDAHPLILVDEFQDTDEDQWRIVQSLSIGSDVVALGDTEQRIYDWRPGVSETRLQDFGQALAARTFDFANENNRSPAAGIAGFARRLISPGSNLELPAEIKLRRYEQYDFKTALRTALLHTGREAITRKGGRDLTVAIAARNRQLVRIISDNLSEALTIRGKVLRPVPHDVMIDHEEIALSSRVVAHCLGSAHLTIDERLHGSLVRIGNFYRATGKTTNIAASDRLFRWANKCLEGDRPNTKCVRALAEIFDGLSNESFSGSPTTDWLLARRAFERADASEPNRIADQARFLRILRRGSIIEEELGQIWQSQGSYEGAEETLERALIQDQMIDNYRESSVLSVMTMHQLKGREYDAVLLVEDRNRSFRGRETEAPFPDTRRLLQMSLTRARHYATIISERSNVTLDALE